MDTARPYRRLGENAARSLCVALHDVAPATWPRCARLLALLDTLGAGPLTLLLVPDYHHRGRIDADPEFVRAIERRIARGDELALHGCFHLDESPAPSSPLQWMRRRLLTAGEGEFAALPEAVAAERIEAGLRQFERLGWHARGFVAPAWLLGAEARAALLLRTGIEYTSTHAALESFVHKQRLSAPCIGASARSAWRRAASHGWLAATEAATRRAPLLRIALHPVDAEHAGLVAHWHALIERLLQSRTAATKSAAIERHLAHAPARERKAA